MAFERTECPVSWRATAALGGRLGGAFWPVVRVGVGRGEAVPGLGHLGEPAVHAGRQRDRGGDQARRRLGAVRVAAVDVGGALAAGPGGRPGRPRDLGDDVGRVAAVGDLGRLHPGVAAHGEQRELNRPSGGGSAGGGAGRGGRRGTGGGGGGGGGRAARARG